ncbi:GDP-mannose 4,6-dehydratase [Synechococcus sp. BMK-MC-1]|uniref:GDP-mannose 4,6-dehydratase n=1 Tax=Synechococcus sp. BMK-MC-1 TaxID=1442551 RepID=UPI001647EE9D|nr:GDP-mannose 4,6-dehydratase [Synechococcus sp. BMK-MC-1]QNI66427.1 GDP-mannose 4/6-dehydratase [Synechococcus sp. BMK-MC-1]
MNLSSKKYRVLVSGITGQTGSYLADLLINQGHEVHGLVRRASSFSRSRIEHLRCDSNIYGTSLFLHYADLSDSTTIRRLISDISPHEVYHLAGQSHVGLSFEIPESTLREVAMATLSMIEIVRDLSNPPRFFHASSAEVFGEALSFPQNENSPFRPVNPYGCSKVFATNMLQVYRRTYDMFICNGILYNHESPRRSESFVTRKITLAAAKLALGGSQILRLGNIDACRDWGYAPEYADFMVRSLRHDEPGDYVVSTGTLTSVRDFVKEAFKTLGINICFEGSGLNEVGIDTGSGKTVLKIDPQYYRPVDSFNLVGDSSKAHNVIGWRPSVVGGDLAKIMANADFEIEAKRCSHD